jgi:hypothetical protein
MLHTLFPRSSRKYARSRFGRELSDFYVWLQKAGYSKDNIRGHLRRLFRMLSRSRKVKADAGRSRTFLQRAFGRYCSTVERSQHFRGTERAYCRFLLSQDRLLEEQSTDEVSLLLVRYAAISISNAQLCRKYSPTQSLRPKQGTFASTVPN